MAPIAHVVPVVPVVPVVMYYDYNVICISHWKLQMDTTCPYQAL